MSISVEMSPLITESNLNAVKLDQNFLWKNVHWSIQQIDFTSGH